MIRAAAAAIACGTSLSALATQQLATRASSAVSSPLSTIHHAARAATSRIHPRIAAASSAASAIVDQQGSSRGIMAGGAQQAQEGLGQAGQAEVVVAYHHPCPDGIFAALAAHVHFAARGQRVRWVPHAVYAERAAASLALKGCHLYLLDYVGPAGFVQDAAAIADRVTVLDHHKTALERLAGAGTPAAPDPPLPANVDLTLDMGRSGATIARDHFRPQQGGAPTPWLTPEQDALFAYLEDADLWRWALPESRAFHAGLTSCGIDFDATKNPRVFEQLLLLTPEGVIARGREVIKEQDAAVAAALAEAFVVQLGGDKGSGGGGASGLGCCLAARGEGLSHLRSQLGNALAEASRDRGLAPVGVVAYVEPAMGDAGQVKLSLRSLGDADTTAVSQAYGGGGHRNASSCIVGVEVFDAWIAAAAAGEES